MCVSEVTCLSYIHIFAAALICVCDPDQNETGFFSDPTWLCVFTAGVFLDTVLEHPRLFSALPAAHINTNTVKIECMMPSTELQCH